MNHRINIDKGPNHLVTKDHIELKNPNLETILENMQLLLNLKAHGAHPYQNLLNLTLYHWKKQTCAHARTK